MKKLLQLAFMSILLSATMFAAGTQTVYIPETVTIGTVKITAGHYKVSYVGPGPAVKVTLRKSGTASIVLDARVVATHNDPKEVVLNRTANGISVLQKIELSDVTLIFESSGSASVPN